MDNRVDMNRSDTVVSMLNFSLKKYSVAIVGLASEPRWMCNALSSFHDPREVRHGRTPENRALDTYYEKYRRTGQHRHQGCVYGANGSVPLGALETGSMPIRQLCSIVIVAAFTALAIAVFVRRDFCNQAGYAQHLSRAGEVGNLPQYGNVRTRCIGVDIRREQ